MSKQNSSAAHILSALRVAKSNGITAKRAAQRFDITEDGFRARITELRAAGYPIYTNRKATGTTYRLGRPTRRVIAAGNFLLSKPGMRKFFGKTIDRNLSLV